VLMRKPPLLYLSQITTAQFFRLCFHLFSEIRPFEHGIVYLVELVKKDGYLSEWGVKNIQCFPQVIIKIDIRTEYYDSLNLAHTTGDYGKFRLRSFST